MIRHLAANDLDELRDLGINSKRKSPMQSFIERREAARKLRGINRWSFLIPEYNQSY